jgi:outer membrane protein assembly factor BamE (lipoprotein component of BamABCDE complex)
MRQALSRMRVGLLGLAIVVLGACSPIYSNHGYVPDAQELSQIQVGKDTRDTVRAKIGDPTTAGLMKPAEWFYVQSWFKTVAAGPSRETKREVVAISFDKAGRVSNVERFGLKQGHVVALSRRVTTPRVSGIGFLQQLFGSIGKFNASQFLNKSGG